MFGEAGNFYILLARNAIAEEITGIAINSWNQHTFSFKYDNAFSYSRLISNADLVSGYTESIDVQANSYTETTITHNMGVVPNIIVSLRALTGQIDRADALTALIQEVTSNTATVRVFNSGTVQSGVNLYWIALRK